MKCALFYIGKTSSSYLKEGIEEYLKRLKHYIKIEEYCLPDVKKAGNLPKDELQKKEGEIILKQIQPDDYLILLDENGKMMNSRSFAAQVEQWQVNVRGRVVFLIGGAYGFSQAVYQRSNIKLSLSKMTYSHQLIRLIFLEQLYRAMTIIRGEKYHND